MAQTEYSLPGTTIDTPITAGLLVILVIGVFKGRGWTVAKAPGANSRDPPLLGSSTLITDQRTEIAQKR